jgi:septation ring formation regulator EzrA
MPGWLQAVVALTGVVVMLSQISARWGGRAQKQDTDGRVLERTADATQRHDVTDATMSATLRTLIDTVSKMSTTLDAVAAKIGAHDVAAAEARAKADAERDRVTRVEAQVTDLASRLIDVDHRQTEARHSLRAEMHTAMAALRAEVTNAPRPPRRG